MSIDGINGIGAGYGALNPAGIRPEAPRGPTPDQVGETSVQRPDGDQLGVNRAPAARRAAGTLPSQAPEGTDPQLWSVLTADERTFFARARAMGPLTYGPGRGENSQAGPSAGGRIDIRI